MGYIDRIVSSTERVNGMISLSLLPKSGATGRKPYATKERIVNIEKQLQFTILSYELTNIIRLTSAEKVMKY